MNRFASCVVACLSLLVLQLEARELQRTSGLRQDVYEKMQEVQQLAEDNENDKALRVLEAMREDKLSPYEAAQTWFLSGYVYYQLGDLDASLAAYQEVMAVDEELPLGMQQNVLSTLAQLCMAAEHYEQALGYIDQLLELAEEPVPDHYAIRAQVLYQLERAEAAMAALDRAMELQLTQGKPPRENWLLLKNAILYQRDDLEGMLEVLRQLVDLYPRDRYLLNLAAIYGALDNTQAQLALMEPLYERGSPLTPPQLLNLASLYLMHEVPYKGAVLLERELQAERIDASSNNLEMLAQAWLMAFEYERSLEPLAQAASLSAAGDTYLRLANTYMELSRWAEAAQATERALEKGGLRDEGGAYMLQGMAYFNQGDFRKARRAFAEAGKHPRSQQLSGQWLQYLATEEDKARALGRL